MANAICDNALELIMNGGLDLNTDDIRVLLVGTSFSWDPATDVYISDIATLDEITASGYSRQALTTETVSGGAGYGYFDADNAYWANIASGQTIGGAVIYKYVSSDSNSPIICYLDLTNTATGGETTLTFNASGIMKISRKSGS